jgi:MFS family permease
MAPATESIMGSLPLAKAGVGSAMNDTTRQVGGAVGVAVIGSVFASIFGSRVGDAFGGRGLPAAAIHSARDSIGAALAVAARAPEAISGQLADAARAAFVAGLHQGVIVAAALTFLGAVVVATFLPARARAEDVARQADEFAAGRERAHAAGGSGT